MSSTLIIKDLALDKDLSGQAMAKVHGGMAMSKAPVPDSADAMFAPLTGSKLSEFGGLASIGADSNPQQYADNESFSSSSQGTWNKDYGAYC